ncbi:unnamed protein product [Macrosiphum euphorbiae]|uniref:Uncharacterized protein n=1 Tax=Macrosiphum euphorbiae TaxID=13131 RepID=A0AAV0W0Q2_9HEMI|nr:unnamed protein product [Macrosiphum euphorbiae]
MTSSDIRYQLHESPLRGLITPSRHSTLTESRNCIKGRTDAWFRYNAIFVPIQSSFSLYSLKNKPKTKNGR